MKWTTSGDSVWKRKYMDILLCIGVTYDSVQGLCWNGIIWIELIFACIVDIVSNVYVYVWLRNRVENGKTWVSLDFRRNVISIWNELQLSLSSRLLSPPQFQKHHHGHVMSTVSAPLICFKNDNWVVLFSLLQSPQFLSWTTRQHEAIMLDVFHITKRP